MSADDELDVRQRLSRANGTLTTHPAPVEQAIRQGRQIRARRRGAALAGLAVVAAVAVAVPATLLGWMPHRPHSLARQHAVTVYPATAQQARRAGMIAWGRFGGERWQLRVSEPHSSDAQCVLLIVNAKCGASLKLTGHEPAKLGEFPEPTKRHGQITYVYGPVAADVIYVKVSLATGTVLTLHPVRAEGERFVGFAAPRGTIGPGDRLFAPRGARRIENRCLVAPIQDAGRRRRALAARPCPSR